MLESVNELNRGKAVIDLCKADSCSLSPVPRGEGWGEGSSVTNRGIATSFHVRPLTLTLSPGYSGEGTGRGLASTRLVRKQCRSLCAVLTLMLIALLGCANASAADLAPPRASDPAVKISLFAAEPEIVTPIGATVDSKGRLLVIESHTHFRPKNYQGPATDRIRVFEDTAGAGKADRITTYFEGETT